jgi:hypothetical protein
MEREMGLEAGDQNPKCDSKGSSRVNERVASLSKGPACRRNVEYMKQSIP